MSCYLIDHDQLQRIENTLNKFYSKVTTFQANGYMDSTSFERHFPYAIRQRPAFSDSRKGIKQLLNSFYKLNVQSVTTRYRHNRELQEDPDVFNVKYNGTARTEDLGTPEQLLKSLENLEYQACDWNNGELNTFNKKWAEQTHADLKQLISGVKSYIISLIPAYQNSQWDFS